MTSMAMTHPDDMMIERLRAGDEDAFRALVKEYHASLMGVARTLVHDIGIAEEVVQETWLAAIRGLEAFEGRSSIRTWLFGIMVNLARKRVRKDGRMDLWEALSSPGEDIDPLRGRFTPDGRWMKPPTSWGINPEETAEQQELLRLVQAGIEALPDHQRMVLQLRDVEGFDGPEVCELLDLSRSNQRVLLHRARNSVRIYVESHLDDE